MWVNFLFDERKVTGDLKDDISFAIIYNIHATLSRDDIMLKDFFSIRQLESKISILKMWKVDRLMCVFLMIPSRVSPDDQIKLLSLPKRKLNLERIYFHWKMLPPVNNETPFCLHWLESSSQVIKFKAYRQRQFFILDSGKYFSDKVCDEFLNFLYQFSLSIS